MRFYIISGEASGDLHGSNLIRELKIIYPQGKFRCWGGDMMEKQGGVIIKHYRDLAFMGFKEVILNIRTIKRNFKFCFEDVLEYRPDAIILIDYPGFNLRVARFAKEHKIPVLYYISPQVWAWKQSRVKKIRAYVDRMFAILPFEKDFYEKFGYVVEFTGNPLLDDIEEYIEENRMSFE
ncbi:MAG: lipid-A-disaccharide synthase, partial [Bacteroidota bacterium]